MPKLISADYPYHITKEEASYITIIAPIGDVIGSLLATTVLDVIGRKKTILYSGVPQFLSFGLIALSNFSPILLYIARLIGGIAEGVFFVCVPIYIGEVAQPQVRGVLGTLFTAVLILGIVVVNIVGYYLSINQTALVFLPFPLLFMLSFAQMPETPYFSLMQNRTNEAEKSLRFLRRKQNVENELASLTKDVNRQMSERGSYVDLFKIKSNRKACIAMAGMRIVQQFAGISTFTFYYQLLFREATDSIPPHFGSILMSSLQTIFTWLASFFIDKSGRKPLLIFSCTGVSLVLILQGVFFSLRDFAGVDVFSVKYLPLVGMVVYIAVFAVGLGSVVNLMLGELFSASIKAKALGLMNIVFGVTMFISTKFYQYTTDTVGIAVPMYTFGICAGLGTFFCWLCVPETKGKTLEEIQQELKGNKR